MGDTYHKQVNMFREPDNGDVAFFPLISTLKENSHDTTPLTDKYVGFYKNIYDLISRHDDNREINDITYDASKNELHIIYEDGSEDIVALTDKYLISATYNSLTEKVTFLLSDLTNVDLDLKELISMFYKKEEVDKKFNDTFEYIDNKDSIKWDNI